MSEEVVKLVRKKNTYKRKDKIKQVVDFIVKDLQSGEHTDKNDVGTIQRCCELIENLIKKKHGINKFDILIRVLTICCKLQPADHEQLKNTVEFLLASKVIKKVKTKAKVYSYVRKCIISNFFFREH